MIFTRFEGVAIAALTLPLLWLKLTWRQVFLAGLIPVVAGLLWIPAYYSIHGSFTGGYLTNFSEGSGDFGNVRLVPNKLVTLVRGAGWGATWTSPTYEIDQDPKAEAIQRLMTQGSWWISLLGVIGIPWLVITARKAALPLLLAATGYIAVFIWWFVYSRFVIPLVPIFYLTAATGASFLILAVGRAIKAKSAATVAVSLGLIWILWTEALPLHQQALGRAWENNYRGYALYQATLSLGEREGKVIVAHSFPMALTTLGFWEDQPKPPNPSRAWYLEQFPDDSVTELYPKVINERPAYVLETGDDPRLPRLVQLLASNDHIKFTETFTYQAWYSPEGPETVKVHTLTW